MSKPKRSLEDGKRTNYVTTGSVGYIPSVENINDILENVSGDIMEGIRKFAFPKAKVIDKNKGKGYKGGTAQRTYLLPRHIQKDIFLRDGYIEGREGDYGLVKKAVGNRNIPVFQTAKDAITRDNLIPFSSGYRGQSNFENKFIDENKELVHAGSYPYALYIDGTNGNIYYKAWDLNDYTEDSSRLGQKGSLERKFKSIGSKILDVVGSPTVVTTGFQPVTNLGAYFGYNLPNVNMQDLFQDYNKDLDIKDYPSNIGAELDYFMEGKGLHREKINNKYVYTLPEITVTRNKKSNGGSIHIAPSKRSIENAGKISDEEYYNIMERVAEQNYKAWGLPSSDDALIQALNDNTYNYRGYYNKYPNGKGNAVDHWTDEFKTVYHPTFSDESIYSGKKSQYNPKGLKGGTWIGEYFVPSLDLLIERNKFKEGGESTNYINTIGLGYIFNKYGKKTIDFIRKRLYNNVLPWGYNDIPQRAYNAIVKNKKEVDETRDKALRDDLWATYLQIPKKERHNIKGGKVTLEKANYSPKGVNPNKEVYKFKDLLDVTKFGLLNYAGIIPYSVNFDSGEYLPIGKNRVVYPKDLGAFTELEGLGQFTVGRGYDKKGDYVSYYDSWDLGETNKNPYRDATFGIGKPFNVYDRIYLDDYFGVPNEHKGGIYLPEVLVTGTRKKHRNGGSINIAPSKRGTFTAAATKHGMGVKEFASKVLRNKDSYSPAMIKKANFARNASKWNH